MNPVHASYLTLSFILILSAHLHLDLRSGLFPLGFPAETLYASLLSPIRATCPTLLIQELLTTSTSLQLGIPRGFFFQIFQILILPRLIHAFGVS